MPKASFGRGLAALTVAAGLAAAVAGGVWWARSTGSSGRPDALSISAPPPAPTPSATPATSRVIRASADRGIPVHLRIPALRVDAPVVAVKAAGGTLVPPSDPQELGWWADGALPGAARGSALVTGHTVHDGPGELNHLRDARPGERIVVATGRGTIRYRIVQVRNYRKGRLARDARRLFAQNVPGRLVVVTCTDWTGVEYLSNTVVTAVPVN